MASNVGARRSAEIPLPHLLVDAFVGFLATVVTMLAVLVAGASGWWAMDWPGTFLGAVAVAFLSHAAHRRGLLVPATSWSDALARSLAELGPLVGGVLATVSLLAGEVLWAGIGGALLGLGVLANVLS